MSAHPDTVDDLNYAPAGLHVSTVGGSGEDARILVLTFPDPNRIVSRFSGATLQLTGVLARLLACAAPSWGPHICATEILHSTLEVVASPTS